MTPIKYTTAASLAQALSAAALVAPADREGLHKSMADIFETGQIVKSAAALAQSGRADDEMILARAEEAHQAARLAAPDMHLTFHHATGHFTVLNHADRLNGMAKLVLSNWKLWGTEKPVVARPRKAAILWCVRTIKAALIAGENRDGEGILSVADKLGAMYFMGSKSTPLVFLAPQPVEGLPEKIVSAVCPLTGTWSVLDKITGKGLVTAARVGGKKSRSAAEKLALEKWERASEDARERVISECPFGEVVDARAEWIATHAPHLVVVAKVAIVAEEAAEEVPEPVAQATAAAELAEVPELVAPATAPAAAPIATRARVNGWGISSLSVGLWSIQYPSGRFGYVGSVPDVLAYVDGSTAEQIEKAKRFGGRFGPAKRTFKTEEEVVSFAAFHGFTCQTTAPQVTPTSTEAEPEEVPELCTVGAEEDEASAAQPAQASSAPGAPRMGKAHTSSAAQAMGANSAQPAPQNAPTPVSESLVGGWGGLPIQNGNAKNGGAGGVCPSNFKMPSVSGDIPASLAQAAYAGTSFSPERRGDSVRAEYVQTMREDWETLHAQAAKGGTLDKLEEEFARYQAGMSGRYRAWLASSSRCVSAFIAGPSNFPASRMNKRADIAHKRLTECIEGRESAMRAVIRNLRPDLRPIMAGDSNAADRLAAKIASAKTSQEAMKAANKAIRTHATAGEAHQVAALLELGFPEAQAVELLNPRFTRSKGFPSWQLTNNNANIRRMVDRLEQIEKAQACAVVEIEGSNGVRIEDDAPANRVRLFFPGKPDKQTRATLKSAGFRWAPSIGAWQAYRNHSTLQTAQAMAGKPDATPNFPAEIHVEIPAEHLPACEAVAGAPAGMGGGEGRPVKIENATAEPIAPRMDGLPHRCPSGFTQKITGKSGKWSAIFSTTPTGKPGMVYTGRNGAPQTLEFETGAQRMRALQTMARSDDAQPADLKIVLSRGEGPTDECGIDHTVASFAEADALLTVWSASCRGAVSDKCDFWITWPDGNTYTGCYLLRHHSKERPSLAGHMVSMVDFYTGKGCPDHMSAAAYERALSHIDGDTREAYEQVKKYLSKQGIHTGRARPVSVDLRELVAQGLPVADLVGLGVRCCGDACNAAEVGAITDADIDSHGRVNVLVTTESGSVHTPMDADFSDALGTRYRLDFKRHGAPYLAQLAAAVATARAQATAAKETKANAYALEKTALAAEFAHLERTEGNHQGGVFAARNMRTELRRAFPGVKFSVKSDYSRARVNWADGPTEAQVKAVVGRFDIGTSDYQTDYFSTVRTAFSDLFGGVQYMTISRDTSQEFTTQALAEWWPTTQHAGAAPTEQDWCKAEGVFSWGNGDEFLRQSFRRHLNAKTGSTPAKATRKPKA